MSLITPTLSGLTRNLRHFSHSFIKTRKDFDLNGSPLLQQILGKEERKELRFSLPVRFAVMKEDLPDGYSCNAVELLGYLKDRYSPRNNEVDNIFQLVTYDGERQIFHRIRTKRGDDRAETLKMGDLILAKGFLTPYLRYTESHAIRYYISPITVIDLIKLGRNQTYTFSDATLFGRVLAQYIPISKGIGASDHVGYISMLTWAPSKQSDLIYIQINRVFFNGTTLALFPFITQLEEGDHLMVTGPLDYFNHPDVVRNVAILAVKAKQVAKVEKMYSRKQFI